MFNDYFQQIYGQLKDSTELGGLSSNSNIRGLDLLSVLPLRQEKVSGELIMLALAQDASKAKPTDQTQPSGAPNQQPLNFGNLGVQNAGAVDNNDNVAPDFNFHFKIIVKLSIFLFIFASYFSGKYFLILLGLMGIYYW